MAPTDFREALYDASAQESFDNAFAYFYFTDERTQETQEIPLRPGVELRVGRDNNRCNIPIVNVHVSKEHFKIYSIIYEHGREVEFPPKVYVLDLQSSNGTYVNKRSIGNLGRESKGYILSDGDVIEIKPTWSFLFRQRMPETRPWDWGEEEDFAYFQGRFIVSDRTLGEGTHAAVYLAEDVVRKKQMACKITRVPAGTCRSRHRNSEDFHMADEERRNAVREIKILSELSHPHIVHLEKAFCSDENLYAFFELAGGGDLFSYLEYHGGTLEDYHCRVISLQIVMAIEYMHSKQIAHRDIKPENVLITQTNHGGRVVLTDFGYAKAADPKTGRLTSMLGTPGYIAPEIECPGNSGRGYRLTADLWSIGILTACLLTGHRDVPEERLSQLSQADIVERIGGDSLTAKWVDVSVTAKEFLRRLLVVDPDNRMTAAESRHHRWFTRPRSEAAQIEETYRNIIQFWKPRQDNDQVIKYLPPRMPLRVGQKTGPGLRQKIPNIDIPYMGLQHRLNSKKTRPRLESFVNTLNKVGTESGNWFVHSPEMQSKFFRQQRERPSQNVSGTDIFGEIQHSQEESDSSKSNFDTIQQTGVEDDRQIALTWGEERECAVVDDSDSDTESILISYGKEKGIEFDSSKHSDTDGGKIGRKRVRRFSESISDKRVHSSISKAHPPFASAKVLGDTISQQKGLKRIREEDILV